MKTILFGIFAHPDDEAMGPSATLIKEVQKGTELHLICATNGEAGANPDGKEDLGACRIGEWQAASQAIGATKCYPLGYSDGGLCCNMYHDIANNILGIIYDACNAQTQPLALKLMTLDTNGITGHLDHIAISFIATFVFYKLKSSPPANTTVVELAYFCLSKNQAPDPDLAYFVYCPQGHENAYITRSEPVPNELIEKKFAIARMHTSQRSDAEALVRRPHSYHETDNFHVIT